MTIAVALTLFLTPIGTWFGTYYFNKVDYYNQKIDDATSYTTKKTVEDTCRTMIASYESDKITYLQYVDSNDEEKQSWAEQAKMRANRTASTYNNYILENTFVFNGNVPYDICSALDYIQ